MIAAIENAITARLKAASASDVLGYKYRTLETYPEDWDEYLKEKVILAPAAWVVFAGWRKVDGDTLRPTIEMNFGLVVMAENMRNETATRHGAVAPGGAAIAGEPGSYQLAEDAFQLLAGHDLGLAIGPLEFRSLRIVSRFPALKERKVSMLALELATQVQLVADDADEAQSFATFHANWDIPAFGNVDGDAEEPGVQIPADNTADATDHVELETTP